MLHQAPLILLSLVVATSALAGDPAPAPVTAAPPPAAPPPAAPVSPAKPAAGPVTLKPVDDKTYADVVKARKGKVVFVSFWASYCAPCLEEIPGLLKLKEKLATKGAEIVVVNVDPPNQPEMIQKVAAKRKFPAFESLLVTNDDPQPFINAVDPKWAGEVPFAAIYGKDGKLQKTLSGEQSIADIEKAIDEVSRL